MRNFQCKCRVKMVIYESCTKSKMRGATDLLIFVGRFPNSDRKISKKADVGWMGDISD